MTSLSWVYPEEFTNEEMAYFAEKDRYFAQRKQKIELLSKKECVALLANLPVGNLRDIIDRYPEVLEFKEAK